MANELKHGSVGTELTQAEWEAIGTHVFNSQATGDIVYASSSSQLSRLGKGADNTVLHLASGIPAWSATLAGLTLTTPTISSTGFANATHAHAASNSGGTISAGALSGTTLASGVVTTSATTVGVLNSGSINTSFGNIDVGASSIAGGSFDASDGNITNVGDIALDSLSADGTNIIINGAIDVQAGYANGGGAPYDGVVDVGGGGNWTTIQAGDDDLDAGAYTMLVKQGTYAAGATVSTDDGIRIVLEPGTIVQAAIILSGDYVTLVIGAGSSVTGLITMSGNNCSVICENGVDLSGVLMSGNFGYVNGGGWATLSNGLTAQHGLEITGDDCIAENFSAQTTGGGGASKNALSINGARSLLHTFRVVDSDSHGVDIGTDGGESTFMGGTFLLADGVGIVVRPPSVRLIGINIVAPTDNGINVAGTGDNCVVTGCTVSNPGSTVAMLIDADAENCLVVANRMDVTITDNSGTSTVTANNLAAF